MFNSRIIGKSVYLIGQGPIKNLFFSIQNIEYIFTEVLAPRDQTNLLHTVVVLHRTHHIKWHDWSWGGDAVKMLKNK